MPHLFMKPASGFYKVRAYCAICGKLLQESNALTQRQLVDNWNDTVLNALQFACDDCKTKSPNYKQVLKVVDTRFNDERLPEEWPFLKIDPASSEESVAKMFAKFREEARKQAEEAGMDVDKADEELAAMKDVAPVTVSILEDGTAAAPVTDIAEAITKEKQRRKKNAEKRPD